MVACPSFTSPATTTLASPCKKRGFHGACKVPASAFSLPPSLSALTSRLPISLGAVGQLFDVSCLFGKPEFANIQEDAFNIWSGCPSTDPLEPNMAQLFKQLWDISVVGQHYFVDGNNDTLVPVFDFTSSGKTKGNKNAILFGEKIEDIQSPNSTDNVDWLELQEVSVKGQPPASCEPGSADITVKYAAKYLLTN
ncbi:hypothetical protein BJV77DRAFT_1001337 [Russula vinacea]|nr:hypothetical protein BJV77DRAFT_1001337 [Russula vinacea]